MWQAPNEVTPFTEPFYWLNIRGVLGWGGGFWGMQNVYTCESQSKNLCPLIFCDFCTIRERERERGTRAIWCFERLQMALIRTSKICLALSLSQQAREGNWQEKKQQRKGKRYKESLHWSVVLSKFHNPPFFLFLLFPPLPPTLPSLMLVVCKAVSPRIPSLSGCCVIYAYPLNPPTTLNLTTAYSRA